MGRIDKYRGNYLDIDVNKLKLIVQGHEGKVYLLPDNKVLKVFYTTNSCKRQTEILLKIRSSSTGKLKRQGTIISLNSGTLSFNLINWGG